MGIYSFTGAAVFVTIAATGVYDIDALGAQGGNSTTAGSVGGKGAEAGGNFTLTMGERLELIVGGQGASALYAGGGGGTFVLANTGGLGSFVRLLIAGGGGGGGGDTPGSPSLAPGGAGTVDAGNGAGGIGGAYAGGGGSGVQGSGTTAGGLSSGKGGANRYGQYTGGAGFSFGGGGNGGFGGGGGGGGGQGSYGGGTAFGGGGGGGNTGGNGTSYSSGSGGTSFDSGTAIAAQTMAGVQAGNGSVTITQVAPFYCPGTLILTNRGEVPVEVLAIGDVVVTASGEHRPVKWLGRRSYAGRFLAANPGVQPIRFHAGSLGGGLPRRDLLVSPEHAMVLDGVLVPARCLVNGSTIVQEGRRPRVDYYHVELDSHDVLLAEGAPSESYVEDANRGMFHNAADWDARHPGRASPPAAYCLPRLEAGFELDAIQQRLAALAEAATRAA